MNRGDAETDWLLLGPGYATEALGYSCNFNVSGIVHMELSSTQQFFNIGLQ